jgi:hypothetical protein
LTPANSGGSLPSAEQATSLFGGISVLTTIDEASRNADMMTAAVSSSLRVLRMRPAGCAGWSSGSPLISGMTATPVSKPDSPRASFGNSTSTRASMVRPPVPRRAAGASSM